VPSVTQPLPPTLLQPAAEPAKPSVAAAVARDTAQQPSRRPELATTDDRHETGSERRLTITFPTHSAYFLPATAKLLQLLLAELEAGERHKVFLQVAVSGTNNVVGAKSPEEATRYNTWLAERRLEQVQQWLLENADPDMLSIKPEYQANNESRQVVVRVAPGG
jgi:hypothetical protein